MGTSNSNSQHFKRQQWVDAKTENPIFGQVNPYCTRMLINIINQNIVEEYIVNFNSHDDYTNYKNDLQWRNSILSTQEQDFIYPVKYFVDTSENQFCTVIYSGLFYAEKVQVRLIEIGDIPFYDLPYLYLSSLKGFKILYEKAGGFQVREDMIFINLEGKVKVWMNPNLSKNYPLVSDSSQSPPSQSQMVKMIINLVQQNVDTATLNVPLFSEYLTGKSILNRLYFQQSFDELFLYADKYFISINHNMKSIEQLFKEQQQQLSNDDNFVSKRQSECQEINSSQDLIDKINGINKSIKNQKVKTGTQMKFSKIKKLSDKQSRQNKVKQRKKRTQQSFFSMKPPQSSRQYFNKPADDAKPISYIPVNQSRLNQFNFSSIPATPKSDFQNMDHQEGIASSFSSLKQRIIVDKQPINTHKNAISFNYHSQPSQNNRNEKNINLHRIPPNPKIGIKNGNALTSIQFQQAYYPKQNHQIQQYFRSPNYWPKQHCISMPPPPNLVQLQQLHHQPIKYEFTNKNHTPSITKSEQSSTKSNIIPHSKNMVYFKKQQNNRRFTMNDRDKIVRQLRQIPVRQALLSSMPSPRKKNQSHNQLISEYILDEEIARDLQAYLQAES